MYINVSLVIYCWPDMRCTLTVSLYVHSLINDALNTGGGSRVERQGRRRKRSLYTHTHEYICINNNNNLIIEYNTRLYTYLRI